MAAITGDREIEPGFPIADGDILDYPYPD